MALIQMCDKWFANIDNGKLNGTFLKTLKTVRLELLNNSILLITNKNPTFILLKMNEHLEFMGMELKLSYPSCLT